MNFILTNGISFHAPHATEAIIPELLRTVWEEHQPQGKAAILWELLNQGSVSGDCFCTVPESQALTPEGWKNLYELEARPDLPIATLNSDTGAFEWQAFSLNTFWYEGDLIHHKSTCMDHLVTPEHDMWVKANKMSWRKKRADTVTNEGWRVKTAADVWEGAYAPITIPGSTESKAAASRCPAYTFEDPMDLAEFVGWYVSEGSPTNHDRGIQFAQTYVNLDHRFEIIDLICRLGFHPTRSAGALMLHYAPLARWAKATFGDGSKNKHLPAWVKNWPKPMLLKLLETLRKGDGTKDDTRPGRLTDPNYWVYTTSSDQLIDDLQEIAAKVGWSSSAKERKYSPYHHPNGKVYEGSYRKIHFVMYSERGTAKHPQKVPYSGLVWCPTVPNGLWFMRHGDGNGRDQVVVTGNSKVAYEDGYVDPAGNQHPPRIRIIPLNSAFCVDDQTEILTRRGWLNHDQVDIETDTCWCVDLSTGEGSWQPFEGLQRFLWDGPLIRWDHPLLSALTTPDHRWLVFTNDSESAVYKTTEQITDDDQIILDMNGPDDGAIVWGKQLKITEEHYTGWVWCPTTSTGTWLARRPRTSGKEVMPDSDTSQREQGNDFKHTVYVTGNCFPEKPSTIRMI